jgi:hypothetical protein
MTMTESPLFMTDVVKDIGNPNRFRWNIYENRKVRDKSFYSFATKREAQSDAEIRPKAQLDLASLRRIKMPADPRCGAGALWVAKAHQTGSRAV